MKLTALVGTMQAAYLFAGLALLALPAVLGYNWLPPRTLLIVGWISQTLIQLVMLAVLQLGQNIQGHAADARSESTYKDAEAILHGQEQQAEHLAAQDAAITSIQAHLEQQDGAVAGILTQVQLILEHVRPVGTAP